MGGGEGREREQAQWRQLGLVESQDALSNLGVICVLQASKEKVDRRERPPRLAEVGCRRLWQILRMAESGGGLGRGCCG